VELGSLVLGSLAYTVIQNKMSGGGESAPNPLGAAAAFFGGSQNVDSNQPMYAKPQANHMKGPPRMESLGVNSWGGAPIKTPPPQFEIIEEVSEKRNAKKEEDDEEALYKKFLQRAREEEAEKTEKKTEKTQRAGERSEWNPDRVEKLDYEDDDLKPSTYDEEPKRIILSATRKKKGGANLDL
jgi:hypothetical protein